MGTGSVALWLLRLFRVCRRCLSPFSTTRLQFEMFRISEHGPKNDWPAKWIVAVIRWTPLAGLNAANGFWTKGCLLANRWRAGILRPSPRTRAARRR